MQISAFSSKRIINQDDHGRVRDIIIIYGNNFGSNCKSNLNICKIAKI